MKSFQRISLAVLLTLSVTTISLAGTIPGSRSGDSRVGTITGSRVGTISGSKTGTITGSSFGTISGSRAGITPTEGDQSSRFRIHDGLVSSLWVLLSSLAF